MKKLFVIAAMLTASYGAVRAQAVVSDNFDHLQVAYKTATPELQNVGGYAMLTLPGYTSGGEVGAPALPIRNDIIEVPFCDDITVTVENAVYDTIQFSKYNIFYPLQPSRSKSDTSAHQIAFDKALYSTDAFFGQPLAKVEVLGIARDCRLAQLSYSPVQVNPVTGQVVICRSADVTVSYVAADADATLEHYQRYHSPAFSVGTTLNNLFANAKHVTNVPIRMVIAVPNSLACQALENFATWKRRQGMMVDLLYYQDQGISSNTDLASYLTSLYTNATADAPAPTFLILVGDHNQLPAFSSRISSSASVDNDHITDLYFTTWTSGDNLPDCYQGRFSATNTSTVTAIVNKTLLYEKYNFSDDSYLARAALISGEDNGYHTETGWWVDNAWIYCDPSMDYVAYNYVNADHGYTDVTYYKNDVNYAPNGVTVTGYCSDNSTASALRTLYNSGVGLINYTAHGDWDYWYKPRFSVDNVSSMNNVDKPSVMIGNCCLTNKFDKSVCFGEALLRRTNNAGAVVYIGGTNSTYWAEDFYWTVGIRSNVTHTLAPNYNANYLGIYDRLFHTHGEAFSKCIATAGAMVYFGNLAVNSSNSDSSKKKYYWEIYELMGDPSLLPWFGRAAELEATGVRSGNEINITTLPNAYVAIVDNSNYQLYGAAFADADGHVTLNIPAATNLSSATLAITAQNHKPYFQPFSTAVGIDDAALDRHVNVYPNPATDRVTVDGLPEGSTISLFDAQGRQLLTTRNSQFSILNYPAGLYLLRIQTPSAVTVRKLVIE